MGSGEKQETYDEIEKSYHELVANESRIKALREHYLQICGKY